MLGVSPIAHYDLGGMKNELEAKIDGDMAYVVAAVKPSSHGSKMDHAWREREARQDID